MNPEKGTEADLRNIVTQQTSRIGELEIENQILKDPPKNKRDVSTLVKTILTIIGTVALILAMASVAIYILIWICEPASKMVTYQGKITSITTIETTGEKIIKKSVNACETKTKNGKIKIYNCRNIPKKERKIKINAMSVTYRVAFTDIDGDFRSKYFSIRGENDWNGQPPGLLNHRDLLPFPEEYKDKEIFVANSKPYPGCTVKVFELRGRVLNSNTSRNFVVDASMCKKPK